MNVYLYNVSNHKNWTTLWFKLSDNGWTTLNKTCSYFINCKNRCTPLDVGFLFGGGSSLLLQLGEQNGSHKSCGSAIFMLKSKQQAHKVLLLNYFHKFFTTHRNILNQKHVCGYCKDKHNFKCHILIIHILETLPLYVLEGALRGIGGTSSRNPIMSCGHS